MSDGTAVAIEIAGETLSADRRTIDGLEIELHRDIELAGETITCAQLSACFGPPHHRGKHNQVEHCPEQVYDHSPERVAVPGMKQPPDPDNEGENQPDQHYGQGPDVSPLRTGRLSLGRNSEVSLTSNQPSDRAHQHVSFEHVESFV